LRIKNTDIKPGLGQHQMKRNERAYTATVQALFRLFSNAVMEKFNTSAEGKLTKAEVEAIFQYFNDGSPELDMYYQQLFRKYDELNSAMHMNRMRSDVFNRLIVNSFEDQLTDRSAPKGAKAPPNRIPREILPAFFNALRQILGEEFIEKSEAECISVRRIIEERDGPAFKWETFYADPLIVRIQQRALARFVIYFRENLDRKKKWFVKALNYNVGDGDIKGGLASSYLFNEGKLKIMLLAMIRYVDNNSLTPEEQAVLLKNIGDKRIKTIERVRMDVKLLDDNRLF